jgi:hypothetical protein
MPALTEVELPYISLSTAGEGGRKEVRNKFEACKKREVILGGVMRVSYRNIP